MFLVKRLFTLIILFLFNSTCVVRAEDLTVNTPLRDAINRFILLGKPRVEIKQMCQAARTEGFVGKCGNFTKELNEDYIEAKLILSNLKLKAASYSHKEAILRDNFLSEEQRSISQLFQCMQQKYDEVTLECTTNHAGKIGEKVGTTPGKVYGYVNQIVASKEGSSLITIGSFYFMFLKPKRIGILLHELSHLCGTFDHKYFLTNEVQISKARGIPLKGIDNLNADNLYWWTVNGFCLPGFDCVAVH